MKKYHLLLMLVVILGIYSCQKMFIIDFEEETVSMQAVENPVLVETVKKHYFKKLKKQIIAGVDERFSTTMSIRTKSRSKAEDLTPKVYAIWKKAHTVKYGQRQILEVPLHSSHRIVSLIKISRDSIGYIPDRLMLKTIFDRLVVSKPSADEDYVAKIIRYHPDRSFLEKHQYDVSHIHLYNLDGFTGYLEYRTVENKRISIVRVVEGRPVKRYYMGAKRPAYNRQKTSNMTLMGYEHCWDECEIEYGEICVGEVDGDPDDPSGDICFEEPIGENCWPVCEYIDDDEGEFCDIPENWNTSECNGGGEEEEPEEPNEIDSLSVLLDNRSTLTTEERKRLKATLDSMLQDCLGEALFAYMSTNNKDFAFDVDPNMGSVASYNYTNDQIKFKNLSAAALDNLPPFREELFHAYQNFNIAGGLGQYIGPGRANIEFEAKLMKDMIIFQEGIGGALSVIGSDYQLWLIGILENGYPTNYSLLQDSYFDFMERFVQDNPGYGNTDIDYSFLPTSLLSLINTSDC